MSSEFTVPRWRMPAALGGLALATILSGCGDTSDNSAAPEITTTTTVAESATTIPETLAAASPTTAGVVTTAPPTTAVPTTAAVITAAPTTVAPVTAAPTTAAPTTAPTATTVATTPPSTTTTSPSTTTSTTTPPSTTTTTVAATGTAACVADPNYPAGLTLLTTVSADIDSDGSADTVEFSGEDNGSLSTNKGWIRVTFANGGVADGAWDLGFEMPVLPAFAQPVDLTQSPDGTLEIVITHSNSSSGPNHGIMALDQCSWVPVSGSQALTKHGSVGTFSTWGCNRGAHGSVEIAASVTDNNAGTWTMEAFALNGTTLASIDSFSGTGQPGGIDECVAGSGI